MEGDLIQSFREMASRHDMPILLGSIYKKTPDEDNRLYKTSILINRQGELTVFIGRFICVMR
ncbi:MAG: membrane protein DedA with SNARE-associated domain [Methylophagaceae bacterium]